MEDYDLVARAKQGCPEARAELVERYQEPIFRFLYRVAGQSADAEDLTQEVFLRAFRKLDTFRSRSRLGTWLFAIAANTARNWHRNERRRRHLHLSASDDANSSGLHLAASSTVNRPEAGESAQAVRRAVGSLRPRERMALVLKTYEGLSYEEIGTVMGCSNSAVRNLLYRARKQLAEKLRHVMD